MIHDGSTHDDPLLGLYCGNSKPSIISSTSNQMSIMFKSDESETNDGFQISYKIIQQFTNKLRPAPDVRHVPKKEYNRKIQTNINRKIKNNVDRIIDRTVDRKIDRNFDRKVDRTVGKVKENSLNRRVNLKSQRPEIARSERRPRY